MLLLYHFGIKIYYILILIFSIFNKKAALWISGRKDWEDKIPTNFKSTINAWFHFASLGEFEQGKPVLENFRKHNPTYKIVITFFSPSGFENKKNYALADLILYLPIDTKYNAKEFIRKINPKIIVITKYEYWYHYFSEAHSKKIPIYIISAIFRKDQIFFKFYGLLHKRMLGFVKHFFLQDAASAELLKNIGIKNFSITGDTRFDTVYANYLENKKIDYVDDFKNEKFTLIAGSTWPEDEQLLKSIIHRYPDIKLIIAPHEISEKRIKSIIDLFELPVKYSQIQNKNLVNYRVLIIDSIGILSHLYKHAELTYVGGGFGKGIHNTLEAAVYGKVILFGPNYKKFKEAKDLIEIKSAYSVNKNNYALIIDKLINNKTLLASLSNNAKEYVVKNTGATIDIVKAIESDIYSNNL